MPALKNRFISLITYLPCSAVEEIAKSHESELRFFEYAFHDRDEGKVPHVHINLELYSAKTFDNIKRWFRQTDTEGVEINTMAKSTANTAAAHDYLRHANAPEKFQYGEEVVKILYGVIDAYRENKTDLELAKEEAELRASEGAERVVDLLKDIINDVSTTDLVSKYGRDYVINRRSYHETAQQIMLEQGYDIDSIIKAGRSMDFARLAEMYSKRAF